MKHLSLFLLLMSATSFASDYHSPRTASLGGAGHAAPLLNDAIYLNPSFTSFLPTFSMAGGFQPFYADASGSQGNLWHVSVQDGRTEMFQAGLGFTKREAGIGFHVGASKAVVDRIGIGIGGKYFMSNETRQAAVDMTFSTSAIPFDWLQFVIIVDNIIASPQQVADWGLHREITFGTKVNLMGITMLYLDPHWTPSLPNHQAWGVEAGIEFTLMKDLFLRAGAFYNAFQPFYEARGQGYAVGIGWAAPRLSLDYALTRVVATQNGRPAAFAHTFGATVYF